MIKEIRLPEISEDIDTAEVVNVLVSEGDTVEKEQGIVEMETQKAIFEVPSPEAGKIDEILVKKDDTVKVGEVIAKIEISESGGENEPAEEKKEARQEEEKKEAAREESVSEEPEQEEKPEKEKQEQEEVPEKKEEPEEKEEKETKSREEKTEPAGKKKEETPEKKELVPAAPSVRRFAREIGVDIADVSGSGPHDRISIEDVKAYAKKTRSKETSEVTLPDFSRWGETTQEKMSRVRQITADHTAASWNSIPTVTQFDKADISNLGQFRKKHAASVEKAGGKLTLTAILVKVAAQALKLFPRFNASLDMEKKQIIFKSYINIGVAVDTDRGLLVPVIKHADQKTLTRISVELTDLADRTRNKKIKPDELQGGNFTISNLGGIGGSYFTPIVYAPQVAILGAGQAEQEPVYRDSGWEPRLKMPLALSYDHRIIDGADGIRFLNIISESLENPMRLFL